MALDAAQRTQFRALLAIANRSAPWADTAVLQFAFKGQLQPSFSHKALELYAALAPGRALGKALRTSHDRDHRAYNWGDDTVWLGPDGGGVLDASSCFGALPGDGVDDVLHVLPDATARVMFHEATDYGQSELDVTISATTPARLEAIRLIVQPFFVAAGLPFISAR